MGAGVSAVQSTCEHLAQLPEEEARLYLIARGIDEKGAAVVQQRAQYAARKGRFDASTVMELADGLDRATQSAATKICAVGVAGGVVVSGSLASEVPAPPAPPPQRPRTSAGAPSAKQAAAERRRQKTLAEEQALRAAVAGRQREILGHRDTGRRSDQTTDIIFSDDGGQDEASRRRLRQQQQQQQQQLQEHLRGVAFAEERPGTSSSTFVVNESVLRAASPSRGAGRSTAGGGDFGDESHLDSYTISWAPATARDGEAQGARDDGSQLSTRPRGFASTDEGEQKSYASAAAAASSFDEGGASSGGERAALVKSNSVPTPSPSDGTPTVGAFKLGRPIGAGSFGQVYQGMNLESGALVAVKTMFVPSDSDAQGLGELRNEVALMASLSHANIVRYLGAELRTKESKLFILQEWVPGGSLQSVVKQYGALGDALSANVLKTYLRHILDGLVYLHANNVVHRDLKPDNVLINEHGTAKLSDFGTSKRLGPEGTLADAHTSLCGTPFYMSPETMQQSGSGRKADIWSLGGIVLFMSTGEAPWQRCKYKSVYSLIAAVGNGDRTPPFDEQALSADTVKFMQRCFFVDPQQRPSADDLQLDPLFQNNKQTARVDGPRLVSPEDPLAGLEDELGWRDSHK